MDNDAKNHNAGILNIRNSRLELVTNDEGLPYYHHRPSSGVKLGTIVFIHGYEADSTYFESVADAFPQHEYYAFELAGHGYTPLLRKEQLSVEGYKEDIIRSLKRLDLKDIYLIGHSMGGGLAMLIAAAYPHIKRLVLITPMNTFGTTNILGFLTKFNPKTPSQAREFFSMLLYDDSILDTKDGKDMIEGMLELNNDAGKDFRRLYFSMASPLNLYRLYVASGEISCPTLLFLGAGDGCISYKSTAKHLSSRIDDLRILIYDHSGHLPFWEEHDKFVDDLKVFINMPYDELESEVHKEAGADATPGGKTNETKAKPDADIKTHSTDVKIDKTPDTKTDKTPKTKEAGK